MQAIKYILLCLIFLASSGIGILYSKKYTNREKELKEMKNALSLFKTKLRYTYETVPEIFTQIAEKVKEPIASIFYTAANNMQETLASDAWIDAIEKSENNLKEEDKTILKDLGKLLGQTDVDGQTSQIEITQKFLETQIKEAEDERRKNEKLYSKLGTTIGLAIVIILA